MEFLAERCNCFAPDHREDYHPTLLPKLIEVGFAFFEEGVHAFFYLVGAIDDSEHLGAVHERGVHQVGLEVERHLRHAERLRAHLEDARTPRRRLLLELVVGDGLVDQAHLLGLFRGIAFAQEDDFASLFFADHAGEHLRAAPDGHAPDGRAGLAELRAFGRERDVAHQVNLVAAAEAVAAHHRNDRLAAIANRGGCFQAFAQKRASRRRAELAHLGDVAARAKRLFARAR